MKAKLIFLLFTALSCYTSFAQSVRKPWTELTTQERADYVNAINALSRTNVQNLATEHNRLFNSGIHDDHSFLPWHRIFVEHFEDLLKAIDPGVSVPYWNWHEDWSSSSLLFRDGSGGNTGLLGYTVSATVWEDPVNGGRFNRIFSTVSQPGSGYTSASTLLNFTQSLELGAHNAGHNFIGGDMTGGYSPIDPMFYLHHCMVDKAWNDWYNSHTTADVSLLNNNMITFNGYPQSSINAENIVNSRVLKIWYADNNNLLLNNYTVSGTENYRYTTGNIQVTNFTVPSSTNCTVRISNSGSRMITLNAGFAVNAGGTFTATNTANSGARINILSEIIETDPVKSNSNFRNLNVFPNPSNGKFTISMPIEREQKSAFNGEILKRANDFVLEVYDLNGKLILEKKMENDVFDIDIKEKGVYVMKISDGINTFTNKLVVL